MLGKFYVMNEPTSAEAQHLNSDSMGENIWTVSIQDLPEELLEVVFGFLPGEDLDSCFDVSRKWRNILNNDRFWKKCCVYPEKYYKLPHRQLDTKYETNKICEWRKHFLVQKEIWNNLKRGSFVSIESNIDMGLLSDNIDYVDGHGHHWLFQCVEGKLTIWNITDEPNFHACYSVNDNSRIVPLQDKVLIRSTNHVEVFNFKHPEYKLQLNYRFKLQVQDPEQEIIPDYAFVSGVRHILVDDKFFISYSVNIVDLRNTVIHVWNLDTGNQVSTINMHQQSFVVYVRNTIPGRDITNNNFLRYLDLFPGDNGRFLVNLVDARYKLCHISLFSLVEMKFIKVVARLESKRIRCLMSGDIAVIHHLFREDNHQISVFNVNSGLLFNLTFQTFVRSFFPQPFTTRDLILQSNKVIFKVRDKVSVLSLSKTVCGGIQVKKDFFKVDKLSGMFRYFDPNFLFVFEDVSFDYNYSVSIWNIESGAKLKKIKVPNFSSPILSRQDQYPGRVLFELVDQRGLGILKFDQ